MELYDTVFTFPPKQQEPMMLRITNKTSKCVLLKTLGGVFHVQSENWIGGWVSENFHFHRLANVYSSLKYVGRSVSRAE